MVSWITLIENHNFRLRYLYSNTRKLYVPVTCLNSYPISASLYLLSLLFSTVPRCIPTRFPQVYYLSHAVLFCAGALIEAHVVMTPAICIEGWIYQFNVLGGTHHFLEGFGVRRTVENVCVHRGTLPLIYCY